MDDLSYNEETMDINILNLKSNDFFCNKQNNFLKIESQAETNFNQHANLKEKTETFVYIQMELCALTLQKWLEEKPYKKRMKLTSNYFHQIVNAVNYLHTKGLIHCDLKPNNIFLTSKGHIKIGDFGLVQKVKKYASIKSENGTFFYMSPERRKNQPFDFKSDIYSLGIILFDMLLTFKTTMERHRILCDLIDNNNFPAQLSLNQKDLIKSMLSLKPQDRPNCSELKQLLNSIFWDVK